MKREKLTWEHLKATKVVTPLTFCGDYVISHWPHGFVLSYRPPGQHVPLGTFGDLWAAQNYAEMHSEAIAERPEIAGAITDAMSTNPPQQGQAE